MKFNLQKWWRDAKEQCLPRRKLRIIEGDQLPRDMPRRDLVLLREDDEAWSVSMRCPCGCKDVIELPVLKSVKPRWSANVDLRGRPTLAPSVWRKTGCKSHFWVREGRVKWC